MDFDGQLCKITKDTKNMKHINTDILKTEK